jgi:hypothetical protein
MARVEWVGCNGAREGLNKAWLWLNPSGFGSMSESPSFSSALALGS